MSSSPVHQDDNFMANFNAELVHRVLLTDPTDFHELTMSGAPRASHTPSYEEFARDSGFLPPNDAGAKGGNGDDNDIAAKISHTMKRAFHDTVIQAIEGDPNFEPLQRMILELHGAVRSLIPRRADLHGRLSDDDVRAAASDVGSMVPLLARAAEALSQLESEERSQTTLSFIRLVKRSSEPVWPLGLSAAAFLVSSAAYLHHKTQMCQVDIMNFHLANVLAPRMKSEGVDFERTAFQARFGQFNSASTAPVTRDWIRRSIDRCDFSGEELRESEERRVMAIQTVGWVDELLFHGRKDEDDDDDDDEPIAFPEVLALDVANLRQIRQKTRLSVAGSALALHACTFAGVRDSMLRTNELPQDIQHCRNVLFLAMADRSVRSQEEYEESVASAVVDLARTLGPSIGASGEETLTGITSEVLCGKDPVVALLDCRMREVFRHMMSWESPNSERVPPNMKTGRARLSTNMDDSHPSKTHSTLFKVAATQEFERKGFSFYAPELATACLLATKIIDLVFIIYGESFLEGVYSDILHRLCE